LTPCIFLKSKTEVEFGANQKRRLEYRISFAIKMFIELEMRILIILYVEIKIIGQREFELDMRVI